MQPLRASSKIELHLPRFLFVAFSRVQLKSFLLFMLLSCLQLAPIASASCAEMNSVESSYQQSSTTNHEKPSSHQHHQMLEAASEAESHSCCEQGSGHMSSHECASDLCNIGSSLYLNFEIKKIALSLCNQKPQGFSPFELSLILAPSTQPPIFV